MRPSLILPLLGEPGSGEAISLYPSSWGNEEPFSGLLKNSSGAIVGTLDKFRFNFLEQACLSNEDSDEFFAATAIAPCYTVIEPFSARVMLRGREIVIAEYLRGVDGTDPRAEISFVSSAYAVEIQFHAHGWSGIASVSVDGRRVEEIDLFNLETAIPKSILVRLSGAREHRITIAGSQRTNNAAKGRQILVEEIRERSAGYREAKYLEPDARNRGGAFSPKFHRLVENLPADAVILDIGGGKRQLGDPRYINLEYSAYEEPTMFGDAAKLPFRSNSIDLIYTAAVLEHVRDPLAVGREIFRVLKPGGRVLANSAFMQPVHSEGQHFFNMTPYGIREVLRDFPSASVWWEGSLGDTLEWFINVTGVRGRADPQKLKQFLEIAAHLSERIDYDGLKYIAAGVWAEAVKP